MIKKIDIFTDGACRGNPGPGGWGVVMHYQQHEKTLSGAENQTTNNRMELLAAIEGLKALKESAQVALTTDSQYLRQGIQLWVKTWEKNGWKTAAKKPVKNQDLWEALLTETKRHSVEWHWVKGHSGHPENEQADQLANEAIDRLLKGG